MPRERRRLSKGDGFIKLNVAFVVGQVANRGRLSARAVMDGVMFKEKRLATVADVRMDMLIRS